MSNNQLAQSYSDSNSSSISSDSRLLGALSGLPPLRNLGAPFAIDVVGEYAVGFGGSSDVWKARMTRDGRIITVAVKVLRPTNLDPDRRRKRLEREVRILERAHHDCIAPFYGLVYQSNGSPAIVSPWYENGSADVYLKRHGHDHGISPITIICEIVAGIEHLHELGIVHGDLKGTNVMIDDGGHAKLIDFGLSRDIDSDPGWTTATTTTMRWCAPELLQTDEALPTEASDVYAFGCTALELLTGDVPYPTLSKWAVLKTVIGGMSPRTHCKGFCYDIPDPGSLWQVLESCWAEASSRPAISQVKGRMRFLQN